MAKDYDILPRPSGQCVACEKVLAPGEEFVATVREAGDELGREDYCLACWQARGEQDADDLFGVWRASVPRPQEKRKLLVDDPLIVSFFERLADADTPAKIAYRFVLALVLMRKKLLVYDGMKRSDDEREIWRMHFRGDNREHEVVDPHMDEADIAAASRLLGAIMQGELE